MKSVIVILVVCSLRAEGAKTVPEIIANVSLLLAKYHNVDCLQIFRTDHLPLQKVNFIFNMWKKLAVVDAKKTTGVYSYKIYLDRKVKKKRKVSCYRSLKIMSDDDENKKGFAMFAEKISLKDAIWVLFTKSFSPSFFENARVVFSDVIIIAQIETEDVVKFHEVYRVSEKFPLRVLFLGNWTREEGLALSEENFFERRSDLEGIELRTGSVQNWPASYVREDNGEWDGFLVKLWHEIQALINCTSVAVRGENLVGVKLQNGSWNGLVGMALKGEIDIIVAEVIIDKERSRELDFLYPILATSFQIYTRHLGYEWQWYAILKPLDRSVWMAAIGWIIVATLSWACFNRISLFYHLESLEWQQGAPLNSFFLVIQALCQQGYHLSPNSCAFRILFFMSYIVSSVLIPSYSASLVSWLSQEVHLKSFDSLQDMVADGSYRLLVKENTVQHTFFANTNHNFFKLAYEKLVKPVPEEMKRMSVRESIQSLCHLEKYAVMGVEDIIEGRLSHILNLDCPIVRLTHPVSVIYVTMATTKRNPFWGLINHQLSKLLMSGVLGRIRDLEFPLPYNPPVESELQIGLREVSSAFIFVGFCSLISAFILLCEIQFAFFKAYRARLKRKKRNVNLDLPMVHLRFKLKMAVSQYPVKSARIAPASIYYN